MRFILTKELGRLARWLRLMGFDTIYYQGDNLGTLIIQALRDNRIVITRRRDINHLQKCTVRVNSNELYAQLKEIKNKLNLKIEKDRMFSRCTICNEVLKKVGKKEIKKKVPEYVYAHQEEFMCCPGCGKIYWQGSHWGNVNEVIAKL